MRETTLATLDFPEIGAAFTAVYAGYLHPVSVDGHAIRQHISVHDIDRAHSPIWLDDADEVIALALLGVRGDAGWVGGFGVVPAHRGRGVSHQLMARVQEIAGGLGLRTLWLEVLTQNAPAIHTYQRAGFAPVRDLRILRSPIPAAPADTAGALLLEADPAVLLRERERITPVRPVWQRAPQSLARVSGLSGLALGSPAASQAYAIVRPPVDAISLADIATPDAATVLPLIGALAARFPDRALYLSNEPAESPVCAALDRLGWTEPMRQHEMVYRFA
jgi:GNAT superfamily N-acetyltransferase